MWLHSLKVAQLLRSAASLHTNQSRSYLNHLVQYIHMYNVILLFAFCIIFHQHHHGLGSWSVAFTNVKRGFIPAQAPDVFVFLIFKAVSG